MGANTNWKASDEESGSRLRLKAVWETETQTGSWCTQMLDRSILAHGMQRYVILSHHFPFQEKTPALRTARRRCKGTTASLGPFVQNIRHCFRDTPTYDCRFSGRLSFSFLFSIHPCQIIIQNGQAWVAFPAWRNSLLCLFCFLLSINQQAKKKICSFA